MLYYLIQILIFQTLFLIIYDILHKKDTFFSLNRTYLLFTSTFSLVLPFIKIKSIKQVIPEEYIINLPALFANTSKTDSALYSKIYVVLENHWLGIIYILGICLSIILFIVKVYQFKKLKKSSVVKFPNYKLVLLDNSTEAFSFWNTVYLGTLLSEDKKAQILIHELVHLKQKHSLDLLWFELLKIVFWWNPLLYVYQNRMIALHEYTADAIAAHSIGKKMYYKQLLNITFHSNNISFTNYFFNHSLLKKRIIMLQKSKSKTVARYKYLALIPMIISMILYSSCFNEDTPLKEDTTASEKSSSAEAKAIPFMKLDTPPAPQNCVGLSDPDALRKCASEEIKKYVNVNFNVEGMKSYAKPGVNKIYVRFKIDKTGNITNVQARGPAPELEEEAKRVVSSIPQMIPAEHQGKKVEVAFSLPITFAIQE